MVHQTHIKVRGFHLDVYQHVNGARYLEFLEEARWSYFEDNGVLATFLKCEQALAVVNININYRRAALMDDHLIVYTQFKSMTNRGAVIEQIIRLKETKQVVVSAVVTFIAFDPKQNKAVALQADTVKLLQQLIEYEE